MNGFSSSNYYRRERVRLVCEGMLVTPGAKVYSLSHRTPTEGVHEMAFVRVESNGRGDSCSSRRNAEGPEAETLEAQSDKWSPDGLHQPQPGRIAWRNRTQL